MLLGSLAGAGQAAADTHNATDQLPNQDLVTTIKNASSPSDIEGQVFTDSRNDVNYASTGNAQTAQLTQDIKSFLSDGGASLDQIKADLGNLGVSAETARTVTLLAEVTKDDLKEAGGIYNQQQINTIAGNTAIAGATIAEVNTSSLQTPGNTTSVVQVAKAGAVR